MTELAGRISSEDFAQIVPHPSVARTFSRSCKTGLPAVISLDDFAFRRANQAGSVGHWRALRAVADGAAVLMPALQPCPFGRCAAAPQANRLHPPRRRNRPYEVAAIKRLLS
jgi:hypothetical protein